MLVGKYPEDGLALFGADAPAIREKDMAIIHQPLDFLGLNIYYGQTVRAGKKVSRRSYPTCWPSYTFYHWA